METAAQQNPLYPTKEQAFWISVGAENARLMAVPHEDGGFMIIAYLEKFGILALENDRKKIRRFIKLDTLHAYMKRNGKRSYTIATEGMPS